MHDLRKAAIQFVVTGAPRSGTTYVARVLREIGVECHHERRFNPWEVVMEAYRLDDIPWGDASWLAAPFLPMLPEGTKVFHVVREPLKTLNSIIGTGQIDWPHDYRTFIAKHCWNDEDYWPADVAADAQTFWLRWNLMIERSGRVDRRFRVEDLPVVLPAIASTLGRTDLSEQLVARALAVPADVNTRPHEASVQLTRADLTAECVEMARRYGYEY